MFCFSFNFSILLSRVEIAPKTIEKKAASTTPVASPAAATQTQQKNQKAAEPVEKQAEKEHDWKKHVKESELQEEATINGKL